MKGFHVETVTMKIFLLLDKCYIRSVSNNKFAKTVQILVNCFWKKKKMDSKSVMKRVNSELFS